MRGAARAWSARLAWALAVWLTIAASGAAQSTGSSAGGGSWGSSGSSSGSSSSSSDWGSSSSSPPSSATGSAYEPPLAVQCLVFFGFIAFIPLVFIGARRLLDRLSRGPKIDVSIVQIAIDARARRFVQSTLATTVEASDTGSQAGLAKLLTAAAGVLSAAKLAWIYAGSQGFDPMALEEARATHARLALDARARFEKELIRVEDGALRTENAPSLVAREHEGEGVVVVTLVVAAKKSLRDIDPARVPDIERLLAQLSSLSAQELVALELIWSPAAEHDRMSTDELEARYPELTRLAAVGGRVFCSYCAGPHAAELTKCPHCGAPRETGAADRGADAPS